MMELVKNNLVINEEKSIKNTFLYIRNIKINPESYEAKILSEDNIDNIIKYQIVYEGENRALKYDVSNSIGLDEYLKNKRLKKDDICRIITSIDDILLSIENYLLSENSIGLELKLIRVTKRENGGLSFKFIVIPNFNSDFSYELSKLLIRILRHIDIEDKEALSLAYGLFVRSSKDNYTMNDLMELVDKVYDKKQSVDDDFNIDDLIQYDEELASEISDEVVIENRDAQIDEEIRENSYMNNVLTSRDDDKLIIDAATKDIIGENLLNEFDKKDEKVISFKKNKILKGQVNLGFICIALAPILIVVLPIVYFFVHA